MDEAGTEKPPVPHETRTNPQKFNITGEACVLTKHSTTKYKVLKPSPLARFDVITCRNNLNRTKEKDENGRWNREPPPPPPHYSLPHYVWIVAFGDPVI
ncbi:hypothetical protein TNIN_153571 [Trichonephila inaurata madagascariensis]|uniref:Uncharacterized protein n=1 Tax=Trichonephila inaurata madagascariensis TaxID=2747483 RepID=A0A8X6Y1I6_9ARAC|nr:hypothetical protein TNIN_153571 [Trichonephila inaurata madagascariensis]